MHADIYIPKTKIVMRWNWRASPGGDRLQPYVRLEPIAPRPSAHVQAREELLHLMQQRIKKRRQGVHDNTAFSLRVMI
ncbi:hypothetical protein [Nonomuraea angiospora]|uniref:hypothetical protein n=1 Tax=Nonomuraea TaxID=83681 RepID=UPI00331D921F